jgi:hypothetical protein
VSRAVAGAAGALVYSTGSTAIRTVGELVHVQIHVDVPTTYSYLKVDMYVMIDHCRYLPVQRFYMKNIPDGPNL